jgi:hypothetical protein
LENYEKWLAGSIMLPFWGRQETGGRPSLTKPTKPSPNFLIAAKDEIRSFFGKKSLQNN